MNKYLLILLLLAGCGASQDPQWVTIPAGVNTTWSGLVQNNQQVYQIWLNAEACAGHASREPEVIIVDGPFKCGYVDAIGCSSQEKNIMVVTKKDLVDTIEVIYHESFHLILDSNDEHLVGEMAEKCKAQHEGG